MPLPCQVAAGSLELIGNTPVVRLRRVCEASGARVLAKLESFNPGGSVKDRICLAMIEAAERDGRLRPGGTIVEPTSGNTGIGLAMVAAARGYRLILAMPDTMSEERRSLLRAYGAELVLTPDANGMKAAIDEACRIAASDPSFFMPSQFSNPANPQAHRQSTAREILEQCPRLDAFVAGVGTGGTITGVASVLKEQRPGARIVAVEPCGSAVLSGGSAGAHRIQGIGAGFIPDNLDVSLVDSVVCVSDTEAEEMTRRLAREEGILAGISSGAAARAAVRIAATMDPEAVVLCMLCDSGERYLTTSVFERGGL
ncbi:MAG TPA: cysteine synthase A [Candidatus Binatia bacterium]|jgi:cysteine synthase A